MNEAFIVGGAQIYTLAMERIERMYITEVHAKFDGDSWFPDVDNTSWSETRRNQIFSKKENEPNYSFVVFDRKIS